MKNRKILIFTLLILSLITITSPTIAVETGTKNTVTQIHLDEYGGYFEAKETLASLKSGDYEFIVTNKTNKVVGFQLQNFKTHDLLDMFPLEPNETRVAKVKITSDGFRFRCPINPTPWYELDSVKD
ncbi:MAG: hypothetical protein JKX98_10790 [Alcanivoracaceae bacterium]|nr:hypothetical protein [Alcanivoracaceae bacterium]